MDPDVQSLQRHRRIAAVTTLRSGSTKYGSKGLNIYAANNVLPLQMFYVLCKRKEGQIHFYYRLQHDKMCLLLNYLEMTE